MEYSLETIASDGRDLLAAFAEAEQTAGCHGHCRDQTPRTGSPDDKRLPKRK